MVSAGDEVSASLLTGCATASDMGLYRRAGCPPQLPRGCRRAWHTGATSTTFCRSEGPKRLHPLQARAWSPAVCESSVSCVADGEPLAHSLEKSKCGRVRLKSCREVSGAAGMVQAGKQFRRVNGHLHLRSLRDTLEGATQPVGDTLWVPNRSSNSATWVYSWISPPSRS
jgi:hypothetical protein